MFYLIAMFFDTVICVISEILLVELGGEIRRFVRFLFLFGLNGRSLRCMQHARVGQDVSNDLFSGRNVIDFHFHLRLFYDGLGYMVVLTGLSHCLPHSQIQFIHTRSRPSAVNALNLALYRLNGVETVTQVSERRTFPQYRPDTTPFL